MSWCGTVAPSDSVILAYGGVCVLVASCPEVPLIPSDAHVLAQTLFVQQDADTCAPSPPLVRRWPALKKWDVEYLSKAFAGQDIIAGRGVSG